MKGSANFKTLLGDQVNRVYNMQLQESIILPNVVGQANSKKLKKLIYKRLFKKEESLKDLKNILAELGREPDLKESSTIRYFMDETFALMNESTDPLASDKELIISLKCVNDYEITVYNMALKYAKILGFRKDVITPLKAILAQEEENKIELSNTSKLLKQPVAINPGNLLEWFRKPDVESGLVTH